MSPAWPVDIFDTFCLVQNGESAGAFAGKLPHDFLHTSPHIHGDSAPGSKSKIMKGANTGSQAARDEL